MILQFTPETIAEILASVTQCVKMLGRTGCVIPTSGGVDSATVLKLCSMALGPKNVRALFLPDGSSSPESIGFAQSAAEAAGAAFTIQDISGALKALTAGQAADIVRKYYPDFDEKRDGYSLELKLDDSIRLGTPIYVLTMGPLHGEPETFRSIAASDLRALIANQNVKQRLRMICAYRMAESLHYAVAGTSNRDEQEFGFAVKYGDAASDFYPIIKLKKPDVFNLAKAIGVPDAIIRRTPTTDTYSLTQTQRKFFFGLSADLMRAASSTFSSDADILAACAREGIECTSANGVRSLVRLLSGSAAYNDARLFLDPVAGWKIRRIGEQD